MREVGRFNAVGAALGLLLVLSGCSGEDGNNTANNQDPCEIERNRALALHCTGDDPNTWLANCHMVLGDAPGCEKELKAYHDCQTSPAANWACNLAHEAQAYGCGTQSDQLGLCL
jgi:hypothetical protein